MRAPSRIRLLALTVPATLLATGLSTGAPAQAVGPVARDTCLPIPGLPCLPDLPIPGTTPITATTPVGISGTPKVGLELTATPPTWDNADAETTYQWMRGEEAISGATTEKYVVQPDDVDAALTVVAKASAGLSSGSSTSEPVKGVIGDAIKPTKAPALSGSPTPGSTLTLDPGTWSGGSGAEGDNPTFTLQWYRSNGKTASKITGATKTTYVVSKDDAGRALAVLVTATRKGYKPGTAISSVANVPKYDTTTELNASGTTISRDERPRVRVKVTAAEGTPTGRVVVSEAGKRVGAVTLVVTDNGRATIVLPKMSKGTHTLSARYVGTKALAASSSDTITFTVQ